MKPPEPTKLSSADHPDLVEGIRAALRAIPSSFHSDIKIKGINALDVFTLGAAFGAAIEEQLVGNLNKLRELWDKENQYSEYSFIRQPQTFPDLLLRRPAGAGGASMRKADILIGIELKNWYVLNKENVPNFRFQVTPAVCAPQDLIVIVPWVLSEVISGSPQLFDPFIGQARHVAEYRNYHWTKLKKGSTGKVKLSSSSSPYPRKSDTINDAATGDQGNNFGRIARTGLLDEYCAQTDRQRVAGIEARFWREFFGAFKEQEEAAAVSSTMKGIRKNLASVVGDADKSDLAEKLRGIASIIS